MWRKKPIPITKQCSLGAYPGHLGGLAFDRVMGEALQMKRLMQDPGNISQCGVFMVQDFFFEGCGDDEVLRVEDVLERMTKIRQKGL